MTEKNRKKLKKWIFPAGIFLLLFITEAVIGGGAALSYIYFHGKKDLQQIEKYTVNYSSTLAEAFAGVAELSFKSKKYHSLKTLFHEKIEENTIDEAFFILADGKLIVHSNTTIEQGLMGNIANDEMTYNLDMILQPVTKKSTELFLSPYNIIDKNIPFNRQEKEYLEKYYYKEISSSGWLFTKGVFINGKPVGAVNFIISKDRIFNSIKDHIQKSKLALILIPSVSFIISLIISIIVMFRYRSIQKKAEQFSAEPVYEKKAAVKQKKPSPAPQHRDEIISAAQSNYIEEDLEILFDDSPVIEEAPIIFPDSAAIKGDEPPLPLKKENAGASDDEYITIELLGEIDEEKPVKPELQLMDGGRIYLAPVIDIQSLKKSKVSEIRDAIPVSRKR